MALGRALLAFAVATAAFAVVTYARMAYELPAGSDLLLGFQVRTTFSCDNRVYGYYADVDNNCQLFHVCFPVRDDIGGVSYTHLKLIFCNLFCSSPSQS
jgi:hypothetical protein